MRCQSFYDRLLSGELELRRVLQGDVAAAQYDLRHLELEHLLSLRVETLDFATESASHTAHLAFLDKVDKHLFELLGNRVFATGSAPNALELGLAPSGSNAALLHRLGVRTTLTLGALEVLSSRALGSTAAAAEHGSAVGALAGQTRPDGEAHSVSGGAPASSGADARKPPRCWSLSLSHDFEWPGESWAALLFPEELRLVFAREADGELNRAAIGALEPGGLVGVVCDRSRGCGKDRVIDWDVTLVDPSSEDLTAELLRSSRSAAARGGTAEALQSELAKAFARRAEGPQRFCIAGRKAEAPQSEGSAAGEAEGPGEAEALPPSSAGLGVSEEPLPRPRLLRVRARELPGFVEVELHLSAGVVTATAPLAEPSRGRCLAVSPAVGRLLLASELLEQRSCDRALLGVLGPEAGALLLALSVAFCRAGAVASGLPLYARVASLLGGPRWGGRFRLPIPCEVCVSAPPRPVALTLVPSGARSFREAWQIGAGMRRALEALGAVDPWGFMSVGSAEAWALLQAAVRAGGCSGVVEIEERELGSQSGALRRLGLQEVSTVSGAVRAARQALREGLPLALVARRAPDAFAEMAVGLGALRLEAPEVYGRVALIEEELGPRGFFPGAPSGA